MRCDLSEEFVCIMKSKKIIPWFGNNTKGAPAVGRLLGKLGWCGVPFAGGMPELKHIETKCGIANDLHRQVMNLARVIRDPELVLVLSDELESKLFHVDELWVSQEYCKHIGSKLDPMDVPNVKAATHYFVSVWLSRRGSAGTDGEFNEGLRKRWTPEGGSPVTEFTGAILALSDWHMKMRSWTFLCMDAFDFLHKVRDRKRNGLYIDAPWPGLGGSYVSKFSDEDQVRLSQVLAAFDSVRIVIRYGDHPMIRELYSDPKWNWLGGESKNQRSGTIKEVLITNFEVPQEESIYGTL